MVRKNFNRGGYDPNFAKGRYISMRAGSGLGDTLYLQGVARYFVEKGVTVEVCARPEYWDVFKFLNVKTSNFRRSPITHCAHYTPRKGSVGTNQWQDCCIGAGIRGKYEFKLDWKPTNKELCFQIKNLPGPRIAVGLPRVPLGRSDGVGAELLPNCKRIQQVIDAYKDKVSFILVGEGKPLYTFSGIHLDLSNKTTVSDLIDAAWCVDGFLAYVSYIVPLAESLYKPAFFVWSRAGLNAPMEFFRQVTPEKILSRPTSRAVIDDCSDDELFKGAKLFMDDVIKYGGYQDNEALRG